MNKRTAQLLAEDLVTFTATSNAEKNLLELKHEQQVDSIYDHYIIRIKVLATVTLLTLTTLAYKGLVC